MARFRLNDLAGLAECAHRIDEVAEPADPEQQLLASFTGGVRAGPGRRPRCGNGQARRGAAAGRPAAAASRRTGTSADGAGGWLHRSRSTTRSTAGAARLQEVRRRGAIGVLVPVLAILAAGRAWLGDHAGAFADAGEAAELGGHLGYAADASVAVEMLAWQSAARGLHDEARRSLALARELTTEPAPPASRPTMPSPRRSARCAAATWSRWCRCSSSGWPWTAASEHSGEPLGVAPLLVEAYVGLGRSDEARALTARYAEATPAGGAAALRGAGAPLPGTHRSDEAAAGEAFDAAMEAHARAGDPFEAARTRLLYGGRLRRAGQRVAARGQLCAARDAFESMDLTHWVEGRGGRAGRDRRHGATPAGSGDAPLTSQETRVALLAAQGMSNREIGASLFLSPKTVERHLSNVFRKRGFRSRTELAASFARSADSVG